MLPYEIRLCVKRYDDTLRYGMTGFGNEPEPAPDAEEEEQEELMDAVVA